MHEIVFTFTPNDWISDIAKQYNTIVKIIASIPKEKDLLVEMVELSSPNDNVEDVIAYLSKRKEVEDTDLIALNKGRAYGRVQSRASKLRKRIAEMDAFIDAAKSDRNGSMTYIILTCSQPVVNAFMKDLSKSGKVESINKLEGHVITAKDESVLSLASRAGFYEYPKRSSIRDLARMLNMPNLDITESLRTAQKKIIECYLLGVKLRR